MKDEWLMNGAIVPVDIDTTRVLVEEIKRLRESVLLLSDLYEAASRQRDFLYKQSAYAEALRGKMQ